MVGTLTGNFPFRIGCTAISGPQKIELAVSARTKELCDGGIRTYNPCGEEVGPGTVLASQGPVRDGDLPHSKIWNKRKEMKGSPNRTRKESALLGRMGFLRLYPYPGLLRMGKTVDYPPKTRSVEVDRAEGDQQAPLSLHRTSTPQGRLKWEDQRK